MPQRKTPEHIRNIRSIMKDKKEYAPLASEAELRDVFALQILTWDTEPGATIDTIIDAYKAADLMLYVRQNVALRQ